MSQVSHSHLVFVHGVSVKESESKSNHSVYVHKYISGGSFFFKFCCAREWIIQSTHEINIFPFCLSCLYNNIYPNISVYMTHLQIQIKKTPTL